MSRPAPCNIYYTGLAWRESLQAWRERLGWKLEVDDALRIVTESSDYLCAERLTLNLVWTATHLAAHGELEVSALCWRNWAG